MHGLTISVGYDDLLAITLPLNARHFDQIVVGTSPADTATQAVVATVANAKCLISDGFYAHGATFNKGIVVEECLDMLGRKGWMCIFDADTLLPDHMDCSEFRVGCLYVPPRRLLRDPQQWQRTMDWTQLPLKHEPGEFPGYCQIFHADDPVLRKQRPWYGTKWRHAGGCDSEFQQLWPHDKKIRPAFEVLHLGEDGRNWHGRATKRADGTMPPAAEANAVLQHAMYARRGKQKRGPARYKGEKLP